MTNDLFACDGGGGGDAHPAYDPLIVSPVHLHAGISCRRRRRCSSPSIGPLRCVYYIDCLSRDDGCWRERERRP